ncbi:MAG: DUF2855 family protein, partial [Pseudomonadota bacterium]
QFFPASAPEQGMIPVWGFADVIESNSAEVAVGERIYGYLPPASELVLKPMKVKGDSWFDASDHRQSLPPLYNRYLRLEPKSEEAKQREIGQALLGPLYMTGYLLYDMLKENQYFGAEQVVVVSASSKTSIGLAYALSQDESPTVVGLTSAGNKEFVAALGYYESVATYDALDGLEDRPTVIVDMAGNGELVDQMKSRLGENLKYFVRVGITHWEQQSANPMDSNDNETFFFAPSYMLERSEASPGFAQIVQEFVANGAQESLAWMELKKLDGVQGLASVYDDMCAGKVSPKLGLICMM